MPICSGGTLEMTVCLCLSFPHRYVNTNPRPCKFLRLIGLMPSRRASELVRHKWPVETSQAGVVLEEFTSHLSYSKALWLLHEGESCVHQWGYYFSLFLFSHLDFIIYLAVFCGNSFGFCFFYFESLLLITLLMW